MKDILKIAAGVTLAAAAWTAAAIAGRNLAVAKEMDRLRGGFAAFNKANGYEDDQEGA